MNLFTPIFWAFVVVMSLILCGGISLAKLILGV